MRLSKFLPELFSNLTFLCLHGTFLRCHLKANPGHQIPLSNQEDRCVIPRPACLLTHRGLCYANQDMSTPEFLLLSPVARTAASCESVLRAKTQPSSLRFSFLRAFSSCFYSESFCLPDEFLRFPYRLNSANPTACKLSAHRGYALVYFVLLLLFCLLLDALCFAFLQSAGLQAFSEETEITLNTSQSLKYTCQEAMCNLIV